MPLPHLHIDLQSVGHRLGQAAKRLVLGGLLCAALAGGGLALYATTLPAHLPVPGTPSASEALPLATVIYASDGTELARYYREHRLWVPLDAIAPAVTDALLATEDRRFFAHPGVDLPRLVKAAYETARGRPQGASTLTMQLVRNQYADVAASPLWLRKIKEMGIALKLERRYEKRRLLEAYLNLVPFGHRAHGIEAAAQTYFGRSARALDPAEAALLIGLLKGPSRYDPVRHPERAMQRRNLVLAQMAAHGALAPETAARLQNTPLGIDVQRPSLAHSPAPHFAEHVRRWLESWAAEHGYDPYADGLRVHTTLDPALQSMARAAVDTQMTALQAVAAHEWSRPTSSVLSSDPTVYQNHAAASRPPFKQLWAARPDLLDEYIRRTPRYRRLAATHSPDSALQHLRTNPAFVDSLAQVHARLEAGLVAVDPSSGAVRAWVGSRDFRRDQYDKVALAKRQPGSTFKPFVYAAAAEFGYAPYDTVGAREVRRTRQGRPHLLEKTAAPDSTFTLRDDLTYSSNRTALRLTREMGPRRVARVARRLGVESPLAPFPSLALGTSEVTLLEMTSAFSTLASGGTRHAPRSVTHITDAHGQRLATFAPTPQRALSRHIAYTVLDMMRAVVDRGTAASLRRTFAIDADVAGKTGTTQDGADGWFIMMHPELVTGAWVGFNDRRLSFRTDYWEQGGHNALRLVGDFFSRTLQTRPHWRTPRFSPPPGYHDPAPPRLVRTPDPESEPDDLLRPSFAVYPDSAAVSSSADALDIRAADPEQALRRALRDDPPRNLRPPPMHY